MSSSCVWENMTNAIFHRIENNMMRIIPVAIFAVYLGTCHYLHKKRDEYLDSLLSDDSDKDACWSAYYNMITNDFCFEYEVSLQCRGLLVTYGIPSISQVLVKTGGFQRDVQRRYADMSLLIGEFVENNANGGLTGQPHRATLAIQRLNAIHAQYGDAILYRDMLYVLSVFLVAPCEFCDTRWARRAMTAREKAYVFRHWCAIGRQLHLAVDAEWRDYADCRAFKQRYEEQYMHYCPANEEVLHATVDYFAQSLPHCARPAARYLALHALSALQETPRHRAALGLPLTPQPLVACAVDALLAARAVLFRHFLPPRPAASNRLTAIGPATAAAPAPGVSCPFVRYHPARALDFGNTTYTPSNTSSSTSSEEEEGESRSYAIETLGPRGVSAGLLSTRPHYAQRAAYLAAQTASASALPQ